MKVDQRLQLVIHANLTPVFRWRQQEGFRSDAFSQVPASKGTDSALQGREGGSCRGEAVT